MNLENKIRSFLNPQQVDESTYPGFGRSSESESPMQGSSEKPQINQLIKGAGSDASVKAGSISTLSAKSRPMDKTNPRQGSSKDASSEELDTDAPGKTASAKMKKASGLPGHGAGKAHGYTTMVDPRSVVGQSSSQGNVYKEEEEYDVDDLITEEEYDSLSDEEKADYDEVELVEDFDDEDMYEIDEDDLITEEEYDALSDEEKDEYDFVELEEGNAENKKKKNAFVRMIGHSYGKPGSHTVMDPAHRTKAGREVMRKEEYDDMYEGNAENKNKKNNFVKNMGINYGDVPDIGKQHVHPDKLRTAGRDVMRTSSSKNQRLMRLISKEIGPRRLRKEDVESMEEGNAENKAKKNAFMTRRGGMDAGRMMDRRGGHTYDKKVGRAIMRGDYSPEHRDKLAAKMRKEDLDRDMSSLFSEENNLSEEFMTKAASLFEAAVTTRVEHQVQIMEEIFADAIVESVTEIEEELTDKVDAYLSYVAEQWVAQNELAVVESLRTEITEDFISGLRNLFAESFIEVPDEKYDLIGEMAESIEQLEMSVNEQMQAAISLNNEVIELKRASVLAEVTEGLARTEAEKFVSLVEDVSFEDEMSFAEKLTVLKYNYFPNAPIVESFAQESSENDYLVESDSSVLKYAEAIGRTAFSK